MKRDNKIKVVWISVTILIILTPYLIGQIGIKMYIGIVCFTFLIMLLWVSYGTKGPSSLK